MLLNLCYHCRAPLTDPTNPDNPEGKPITGAISICLYCGALAVFDEDLQLKAPPRPVIDELFNEPTFRQMWAGVQFARTCTMADGTAPPIRWVPPDQL